MSLLDELRAAYPDNEKLKAISDPELVSLYAQATGSSLDLAAMDLGLDPNQYIQNTGRGQDLVSQGILGLGDIVSGVAGAIDIPIAAATDSAPFSKAVDWAADATGLSDYGKRLDVTMSPQSQQTNTAWGKTWNDEEMGAWDKAKNLAGVVWDDPAYALEFAARSAPTLIPAIGGAKLLGMGAKAMEAAGLARTAAAVRPLIPGMAEGGVAAGYQMNNLLEEDVDPREAAGYSALTGAGTGLIGGVTGALGARAGLTDPHRRLAGYRLPDEAPALPWYQRLLGGIAMEAGQEALQSPWEQAMTNVATDQPWDQGLARSAVEGALAGGVIGAPFNIFRGREIDLIKPSDTPETEQQATPVPPGINPPGNQTPNIDPLAAERQRQIDAIMGGETSQTILPGQADPGSLQGLTRDQVNQRLIDAAMGGETSRTFAPGQYPSDVAADLSQQQAKANATRAAEQAKKAVEKQYEKAGWQKTPEKIALLETAQAPKLVSGIYGDEARKFVDSVLTMDAKTAGELFTNLSGSKSKSAPWKGAIAKAHLTNLTQQEAQTLAQQAKQNATIDAPGVPVTPTIAQNAQPVEGAVPPTPTTSSVVQDEVSPSGATIPSSLPPTTPETPTNALSGQTTPQAGQETGTTAPDATTEPGVTEAPNAPRAAQRVVRLPQEALDSQRKMYFVAPGKLSKMWALYEYDPAAPKGSRRSYVVNLATNRDEAEAKALARVGAEEALYSFDRETTPILRGAYPKENIEVEGLEDTNLWRTGMMLGAGSAPTQGKVVVDRKGPIPEQRAAVLEAVRDGRVSLSSPGNYLGFVKRGRSTVLQLADTKGKHVSKLLDAAGVDYKNAKGLLEVGPQDHATAYRLGVEYWTNTPWEQIVGTNQTGESNANPSQIQGDQETVPVPGAAPASVQVQGSGNRELATQQGGQTADADQTQTKPTLNFSRSGQGQPAPGFFSQLKRVVERAKQTTMPGGQWKAWLKANQAQLGVKQEEIEATGIDEYLDARGKDKVTREEIAAFVENNGVRVEEVTKESDTAKFDKWQLPGGTNYKELLLTLPAKPTAQQAELETKRAALHEELRTAPVARQQEILAELDTLLPAMDRADQTASAGQYQSGHYSEPNILAHVRINERTDTEGKRVLFVEEIQSDWGQEGKKKGFVSGDWEAPYREWERGLRERAKSFYLDAAETEEERAAAIRMGEKLAARENLDSIATVMGERPQMAEAWAKAIALRYRVPAAPFVTNTKSWTALALKRLMTYAVENGFDRVAWTTGEQQAERYDLSKQVKRVVWNESAGILAAERADSQGARDDRPAIRYENVTRDKLADYIGKEAAERIQAEPQVGAWRALEGDNLRLGGQGMKAFYDGIVPQVANDLLKKLGGGRVGSVAVNISKGKKTTASQQFGFDITPTMRAKVQGGLPLFARKPNKAKQTSGNTVADVERWIAGPKAKLAQWVTNGLNVVQSVDELRARYPGMDIPDDVVGMHEGGYVFLVADNITSANQARKALAHEVVGHLGLERMLGKKGFERIVRQIDSYIRTQNPAVLQALERVKAKYTDDQGKYNLNQVQEASEILAHLAERNPNFGLIREIIARIRMWFAKHGLGNYAAAELNQLLVEAARFTETGFTSFAEGNFRVAPAYMVAGGRPTQRSGVNAEVAPDPRRIKAGGDQTLQRWAELTYDDQLAITQTLGDSILPRLLQQMGAQDYRVEYTMGGFKGASNPSITIHFGQNVPYDLELEVANTLGVLWRQQAMIAYNEDDTSTGDQVQFVKVIPDRKLSVQEQRDLFANINRLYPQAEGVSTRDGALVFGNFVGATEREFHEGVRDAFNQLETKYNAEIPSFVFRSDWIEPPTLENTDYGQSYNTQTASGRDVLRRRQRNFDSLQSESDALFRAAVDATWQRKRQSDARRDERAGSGAGRSVPPEYGKARAGAIRGVGVHFSQAERQELDGSYYGTGLQGDEAQRVLAAADQRLRQRVYFYINSGAGITPEAGVGGHAHTVALNNLYDLDADSLRLKEKASGSRNEYKNQLEAAVIDAGFDGYVSDFGKQRAAVLIGRHTVPVRYEGMTKPEVPAGERAVPNDIKRIGEILGKTWVKRTPTGFRKVLMREDLGLYQAYADAFTGTGRTYWPDEMVREISKAYPPQREEQAAQPLPETITIDGVERPTTNSEGKPIHPTEAGVRNFWKWFGDSKVVDDQGRPLVMYHGTNAAFDTFDINKAGSATDEGWAGKGFYFHIDPDTSAIFGKNNMAVYLNMRNPYDFEGQNFYKVVQEKGGPSEFSEWLDKNDYDGAMLWGQRMVLKPNQIKSATDNVGTFDGTNPNINFMRGPTKQDASNLWDWIKTETEAGVEAFSRKVGLGALTNEQMADRWGKEFAPLKTIANVLDATEAKAAQWEKKAEDADRDWAALTAEQDQLMSEIMGDASLHGYDPDTGQLPVGHISKEQRARVMAAKVILDARWQRLKTLDANGKHKAVAVYRQVRDYHQQRLQEAINYVRAQLQQKGTVRPDDPLLKSLEALEAMGKRPYFPLMRLGDYYVVGMSPQMADLEKRFRAKQLQPDEDALREKLRRDPKHYWVEGTSRLATAKRLAEKLRKEMGFAQYNAERYKLANARSHVGQDVGKFEQTLEGMALDTKTHDALVEMYEQLLISALPEHHSLKRTLHREGIYGWDKNMRAVFAKTAQTGAWALSRMMHVSDLQQAMSELDEMSKTGEPNAQDARALHNELLARQDLTFTRYEDPLLVQGAMKFSYLSMLGFSPAFWMINLTQPWMVTLPYLTARNGNEFKATSSALWRGVREAFSMIEASFEGKELRTQFNPDKVNQQGQKVRLTADERRMLDTFGADGTLDFTIGYDLGAIAKGGSGKWQKVMRTINAPTHATELANRVGTALAAYRISRQSQHSHEQALEFAKKAVNTTQVNYNPANKARYMQAWAGNRWLPKLAFQFYTYQQAMAYLALSTLRDAIKGDKVAQSTMAWMTGMLGATGGVFALPFAQMTLGAASLIFSALGGGDDEEDVDFQRDLRNLFSDYLPEPVARLLNKGLGSMLLQTDLGARIGMGNLMNPLAFARFEAADKGADTVQEVLFRMGGAPVANVANAVDGLSAMRDVMGALVTGDAPKGSDVTGALSKLFPLKGVRDIFRGIELSAEGVTTGEGEPRLTDFSYLEVALQSAGITPLRKTMYYERNAAIQGAKEAMKVARGDLIREYAQARLAGEPIGPILAKIGAFNRRNPQHRIDQDTLKRSTTQRQKDRQSLDNGILANKGNRPYLAAGRWAE